MVERKNSMVFIYYVLLRITLGIYPPRQIWQVWGTAGGTRAASGRRWPAQNHAFFAYLRVPSPRQGTNLNPALVEDAFTSAAFKCIEGRGGVGGGSVGCTRSGYGGGCSRSSLLPSRSFLLIRVELERCRQA